LKNIIFLNSEKTKKKLFNFSYFGPIIGQSHTWLNKVRKEKR